MSALARAYGDARDHVRRSNAWAVTQLRWAAIYRRRVERVNDAERAALAADGLINDDGSPTPRGETLATVMGNFPSWNPTCRP